MSEVLTTYTEFGDDANAATGVLQETSSTVNAIAMANNVSMGLYKDFTAGYFGIGSIITGSFQVTAATGITTCQAAWGFANSLSHMLSQASGEAVFNVYVNGASTFQVRSMHYETSASYVGSTLTGNLNFSTTYYYKYHICAGLSAYGYNCVELYSDAAMTSYVASVFKARTATYTYRYLMAMMSVSESSALTITASHSNLTVSSFLGTDITTYTVTGSYLTNSVDRCAAASMTRAATSDSTKDYSAGWIPSGSDFTITSPFLLTGSATSSAGYIHYLYGGTNKIAIAVVNSGANAVTMAIGEYTSSWSLSTASSNLSLSTPYFVKLWKDHSVGTYGTVYLAIYNDSNLTSQVGSTVSKALSLDDSYQFHSIARGYGTSGSGAIWLSLIHI